MPTHKHTATDAAGNIYKRNSAAGRSYTHAIIVHFPAFERHGPFMTGEPHSKAVAWASSLRLAEKAAAYWAKRYPLEIVEAHMTVAGR